MGELRHPNALKNLTDMGKGRKKGSKNKSTQVRDDFVKVYQKLGGTKAFIEFLQNTKGALKDYYLRALPSILPRISEIELKSPFKVVFLMGEDDGEDNQAPTDAEEIHIKS